MDNQIFRAICAKVVDEQDPKKLELLKQRLRLLLSEGGSDLKRKMHESRLAPQIDMALSRLWGIAKRISESERDAK
jgi:hypothetical protein